jgi:DNA-directed RNA polymerase subunit F
MKIIKENAFLLSNSEVAHFIKNIPTDHTLPQNVQTIIYEISNYFEKCAVQTTEEKMAHVLEGLKDLKLTKAERLQMINLWPENQIDLHVIIEECEERMSEEQLDAVLALFQQ